MYVYLVVDFWHLFACEAHLPRFCKPIVLLSSAATLAERILFFSASVNGLSLSFVGAWIPSVSYAPPPPLP